ncbi:long-chain-fatty-acid--CoA ligase [Paraburkholderia sp. J63]|uniref:long-chain-fatty-acid--CoA ligase n=1 Tax=Paraburkholderia sp. J63 TaxID=2805434 RepID=UPI002ABDE6DF|nr:long-chain-fatty-acid--CoA ligase [Paraburkholderia sp. J63]
MNVLHLTHWPKHLPHRLCVPATNLADNLAVSARRYPARTALSFYGKAISYRELHERVERLAGFLRTECQVRDGDRVLLDMQNSPAFVIAYYAILRADAIVVPVNPMNLREEIEWYVQDSGARVACIAQELQAQFAPLVEAGQLDKVIVAAYADDLPESPEFDVPEIVRAPAAAIVAPGFVAWSETAQHAPLQCASRRGGEDIALLVYTSGTTGHPKGCMLSHRALNAQVVSLADWNGWTAEAIALATAPLFHVTGMASAMNLPIYAGASTVLLPRWNREVAAELIQRYRVSHWCNVPTMVSDLLAIADIDRYDFSSFRYIGGGGSSMPEAVATRLHALTGREYLEGWGLTEVAGAIHLNAYTKSKRQCLGMPTFDVDTRVIDTATGAQLGVNQQGEFVTRCPSLFSGYWNNEQATREAFVELDGKPFFRTGDIGYFDEDGFYFFADRLKRMINAAGFKVWPAEVEAMLYRHPAIREACIVGVDDMRRGETVKAYVVLNQEAASALTAEDIIEWSRGQMAAYKIPRLVEFVDALPRSGTGKIQWRSLQEREKQMKEKQA